MPLTDDDQQALIRRGLTSTVSEDGGMTCVEIRNFPLPSGFTSSASTLLLRLNPAFPDVAPDMWWFEPAVQRLDGAAIPATDHTEHHLGRAWQRWSRHLDPNWWQSGIDSMESFIAVIRRELLASAAPVPACA